MNSTNMSIDPLQDLTKAIALTGSIYNLSLASGINRATLANIFKKEYPTHISTILRLKNFVEQNSNGEKSSLKDVRTAFRKGVWNDKY